MKKIRQYSILIMLTGSVSFTSCKKEKSATSFVSSIHTPQYPPLSPQLGTDTLNGKEFLFNDLAWVHAGPGAIAEEEVWVGVENRPDLFNNPLRSMEVSIKSDTSAVWITVPKWNWPTIPANSGYVHVIMYNSSFYVESYPLNIQLIGTRVSLKIKFL